MIYNIELWSRADAVGLARDVGHPSFALVIQEEKKKRQTAKAEAAQKRHCSRNDSSASLDNSRRQRCRVLDEEPTFMQMSSLLPSLLLCGFWNDSACQTALVKCFGYLSGEIWGLLCPLSSPPDLPSSLLL